MVIALIIGIGLAIYAVVWLAFKVILPVAFLNSALALAILALVFKKHKTLFATLALVGGGYMLLDITNGWLSIVFVENIVKDSNWISAFVYINAVAMGLCAWILIHPLWLKTEQLKPTEKNKNVLLKGLSILLVIVATAVAPAIYHSIQNPFIQNPIIKKTSRQSQPSIRNNKGSVLKKQPEMVQNRFIVDTFLGTIGVKEFILCIEKVEGNNVEGFNVTGTNKRPVKGEIVNKWTKPTGIGGNYTIFKLILTEPGDDKWDGEFKIDLWISDIGRHGEGSWKAFNGKLEREIKIRDRLNE